MQFVFGKRLTKIVVSLLILLIFLVYIFKAMDSAFEVLCEVKAKNIANGINLTYVSEGMENVQYDDLVNFTKDNNGNITMLRANVITMNGLSSRISMRINEELNKLDRNTINIPLGSITGNKYLAGIGPNIKVKIIPAGNVETEFKTEFIASGINQTIHRIYLEVISKISIIGPFTNINEEVRSTVAIAETVIVGSVPSSYYNLEGLTAEETVPLIEE